MDFPVGGTMAFADVFIPTEPCIPGQPCRETFDFRFDTLTGTVLAPPDPIRSSDGKTFDAFADVVYSTIPTDPCTPTDRCRVHVHGATLQPIQFTVVDPPATSFFDIFVTIELTGPVDLTKPLFEMTLTGDTSTDPEPARLALVVGSALVLIARRRLTRS